MDLATQLSLLIVRIGDEFKAHSLAMNGSETADLSGLKTTQKTNLVAAINEVSDSVAAMDVSSVINDTTASTTTTFSSEKINADLQQLKAEILGGESINTALDTISEIATYVEANRDLIDSLNALAGDRLAVTPGQVLTTEEKTNALTNLGIENLPGAVTALRDELDALKVQVTGLDTRVTSLEAADSASAADLFSLAGRVTANETNHTTLVNDLGDVKQDLVALFEAALQP